MKRESWKIKFCCAILWISDIPLSLDLFTTGPWGIYSSSQMFLLSFSNIYVSFTIVIFCANWHSLHLPQSVLMFLCFTFWSKLCSVHMMINVQNSFVLKWSWCLLFIAVLLAVLFSFHMFSVERILRCYWWVSFIFTQD